MIIGVPKEIKNNENRVALTPAGATALCQHGHQVLVELNGGLGSGFTNDEYEAAGAVIVNDPAEVWAKADMIMKVKEPIASEYRYFRPDLIIFAYLHLAPEPDLTKALVENRVWAIAFETIQLEDGSLPLLAPMSEVAGRMAVQVGAQFLEKPHGGKGVLLGGVSGVSPAEVVIVGGGIVGTNAARKAVGTGASVTILDINPARLRVLDEMFDGRVKTLVSSPYELSKAVKQADLLIGAVLVPGKRAPKLVTEAMVASMTAGSVIVDVAIDQGGSIETIDRVTTHTEPTYMKHGVVHYAVANMPGAVPRTSTMALSNVTLPYAMKIANQGLIEALKLDSALCKGLNTADGHVTFVGVAEAMQVKYTAPEQLLLHTPNAFGV